MLKENCLFCKIIEGKLPSEIVYEDELTVAFKDIHPQAPIHVLIVPKTHLETLNEASASDKDYLGQMLLTAKEIAAGQGLSERGYRLIVNVGRDGGQLVGHLHMHLVGGKPLGPKMIR